MFQEKVLNKKNIKQVDKDLNEQKIWTTIEEDRENIRNNNLIGNPKYANFDEMIEWMEDIINES